LDQCDSELHGDGHECLAAEAVIGPRTFSQRRPSNLDVMSGGFFGNILQRPQRRRIFCSRRGMFLPGKRHAVT
jgi:hypothetical protein